MSKFPQALGRRAILRQQGFTLTEVLIAMALIAVISLVVMGALQPWISFKQKLDTERRLADVKNGLTALYDNRGMEVETLPAGRFLEFVSSVPVPMPDTRLRCPSQQAAFAAHTDLFSESPAQIAADGYQTPWCFFISNPLSELREGVRLYYRNVAVVSAGPDGALDPATAMAADGTMTLGGDDLATIITGREVQAPKLKETLRRLNRVAQFYESYFTARYLSYPDRDITRYYFTDGAVTSTGAAWAPVGTHLRTVGVGGSETVTPWEVSNNIELNNHSLSQGGVTVRSPVTTGNGVLPYTALLRARVPSPTSAPEYAVQTVVGNY